MMMIMVPAMCVYDALMMVCKKGLGKGTDCHFGLFRRSSSVEEVSKSSIFSFHSFSDTNDDSASLFMCVLQVNTIVMLMVQKQMFSSRSILSEMMISTASASSRLEDGEGTDGLIQGESSSSNSEEGDSEEDEKHQPSTQHHPQTLPHYGCFVDDDVEYDGDFRRRNLHHQLCSLRAGVTLLPFFGVNWFFSVLSLEDTSSYSFQVMFSTSNIILSLLIFIFFFVHRQSSQRFARNKRCLKMMTLPRATPADDPSVAASSVSLIFSHTLCIMQFNIEDIAQVF